MRHFYNVSFLIAAFASVIVGIALFAFYTLLGGSVGDYASIFVSILCASCSFLLCFGGRKMILLSMERKFDASMELFQMMDYNERRYNREL